MSLNDTIANLIVQKGRAQGAGVAGAGQAWGSALSQIGQNIGQTLADIPMRAQQEKIGALQLDITKRRADKEKLIDDTQKAISGLMSDSSVLNDDGTFNIQSITQKLSQPPGGGEGPTQPFDVQTIYGTLDPINKVLTEARSNGLKYQQSKANALAGLAAGALRLGKQDGNYFSHASSALASAQKSGLMTPYETTKMLTHLVENQDQIPALLEDFVSKSTLPPIELKKDTALVSALDPTTVLARGPEGTPPPQFKSEAVLLDGKKTFLPFNERTGEYMLGGKPVSQERIQPIPKESTPAQVGSLADFLTRYAKEHNKKVEDLTTSEVATVTKQHTDATQKTPILGGMNSLYQDIDPKAIAAQIRVGKHPPDISQYGRPAAAAIASELARKGPAGESPFDLSSAQREWKAQLNLNRTMNGSQQVRLDESIRSGLAMYDKIDALADQWDGKGWGPLSRANLTLAKEGGLGPKAQSLANQLSGQIGQLTSDVATIEQGGLTPTNESRAVAERSMQDWWGKGTIKDMTAQGRYNMQVRHLARQTQETMTPGNNPSQEPAKASTPAPEASAVPQNVMGALKGAGPGRHTLSDGSVWTVGADGSIKKGS